jgi:TDG/mug DNA glycosylase family protein
VTSTGLESISRADARVLILGTFPGEVSLRKREYYTNRGNAFWRIMGRLAGASPELPHEARKLQLIERGIAVWDVCASVNRRGSLDSAIQASTCVANDLRGFLEKHTHIRLICFNGAAADTLFRDKVLPNLPLNFLEIPRERLPLTSSAHAQVSFDEKLSRWRVILFKSTR